MYTRKNYSVKDMALWTRQDTALLLFIALNEDPATIPPPVEARHDTEM